LILPLDEHRTVSQQVYRSLTQAILTGVIEPGQRLTESFLASRLNTSRAPLREALRRLESEGLVVSFPHRGTFVVEFSDVDVDEIYSIASLIEGFAGRLAVACADQVELQSLQDIVDAMRDTLGSKNAKVDLSELDFRFHLRLVELSHHTRLLKSWLGLSTQIRLSMTASMEGYTRPDHLSEDLAASHQEVVDVLRSGDADRAEWQIRSRSDEIRRRVKAARSDSAVSPTRPVMRESKRGDGRAPR
jgi:DNA-binding GntR family transcriptional regulator